MVIEALSLAILFSAIIAITYRQKENFKMYAIFKPLTTLFIIVIALIIFNQTSSTYSLIIIGALLFSLIGDIFLIKDNYFLPGLASFLIAHICFTLGFTSLEGFKFYIIPLLILVGTGGAYYIYLRKGLKKFAIPVLVYMSVIVVMNWQAINLVIDSSNTIFYAIAIGSILFSLSDGILAYNKFRKSFRAAEILILSTYWISIFTFTIAGLYIQ